MLRYVKFYVHGWPIFTRYYENNNFLKKQTPQNNAFELAEKNNFAYCYNRRKCADRQ